MSPRRIAKDLAAFLAGGPHVPDAPWLGLAALYERAVATNDALSHALRNPRNRAGLDLATAAARRARRDLIHALHPLQSLSRFGTDYLTALNTLRPEETRLAAIDRLKDSLNANVRERTAAWELAGLVFFILGEAERAQPVRVRGRWLAHRTPVVPARALGLGDALQTWFRARSERLYREEREIPRGTADLTLLKLDADPCDMAIVHEATAELTSAEKQVWVLTDLGLDDAGIGARLGIPAAIVKSRRGETHRRLAAFLQAPARRRPKPEQ